MTNQFPAVLIGGPPHSGKSILAHALTRALHKKNMAHYLYRATPDGEGNFSQESDQAEIKVLRRKGKFTPNFVERINDEVSNRIFPLLVDVGGRPRPEETHYHGACTHAVLIIADKADDPSFYSQERQFWHALMDKHRVPIIADIRSVQNKPAELLSKTGPIHGSLSNLERGEIPQGETLELLIEKLLTIFTITESEMLNLLKNSSPTEIEIDLDKLADTLNLKKNQKFKPEQIPLIRQYVPAQTPLALYGRAANWVYATLAQVSLPETVFTFDVRLGWVEPPSLPQVSLDEFAGRDVQLGWQIELEQRPEGLLLTLHTNAQLLNIEDHEFLPLPAVPSADHGVIISGKLPNWLLMAAVRQLSLTQPWLAVYQPQLKGAAVVYSRDNERSLGQIIPLTFGG